MVVVVVALALVALWLMAIMVDRVIDRNMAERYALHLAYYHAEDAA